MRASVEFLLGLLDSDGPSAVSAEDFDGPHGDCLRTWQGLGLVAREPGVHPALSCPHCDAGVPYRLGDCYVCHTCRSTVDARHLYLWPLDLQAVLGWVAGCLRLVGGIRPVDDRLWQLGTGDADGFAVECFYWRTGSRSELAERRLAAYGRLLVFHGPGTALGERRPGRWVPLVELFGPDGSFRPAEVADLLRARGVVRFDANTGAVWVGDSWLGEVPVGSREYHLLACLAVDLDRFVSYRELKLEVLRRSGAADATEEATFCQGLKSRIKRRWVPDIDRLVVTTNKADGYRLRGHADT